MRAPGLSSSVTCFESFSLLDGSYVMKRIIVLVLLCSFVAFTNQTISGQSRPRRVGQTPPVQTPTQSEDQTQPQQPSDDAASQTARPSRPPVLGGANRSPNEQKPSSTQQKDAGPE